MQRYLKQRWLAVISGCAIAALVTGLLFHGDDGVDIGLVIPGVFIELAVLCSVILLALQALVFGIKQAKIIAGIVLLLISLFGVGSYIHAKHPTLYCNGRVVNSYVNTGCAGEE